MGSPTSWHRQSFGNATKRLVSVRRCIITSVPILGGTKMNWIFFVNIGAHVPQQERLPFGCLEGGDVGIDIGIEENRAGVSLLFLVVLYTRNGRSMFVGRRYATYKEIPSRNNILPRSFRRGSEQFFYRSLDYLLRRSAVPLSSSTTTNFAHVRHRGRVKKTSRGFLLRSQPNNGRAEQIRIRDRVSVRSRNRCRHLVQYFIQIGPQILDGCIIFLQQF